MCGTKKLGTNAQSSTATVPKHLVDNITGRFPKTDQPYIRKCMREGVFPFMYVWNDGQGSLLR
jgi:hypothetical protein